MLRNVLTQKRRNNDFEMYFNHEESDLTFHRHLNTSSAGLCCDWCMECFESKNKESCIINVEDIREYTRVYRSKKPGRADVPRARGKSPSAHFSLAVCIVLPRFVSVYFSVCIRWNSMEGRNLFRLSRGMLHVHVVKYLKNITCYVKLHLDKYSRISVLLARLVFFFFPLKYWSNDLRVFSVADISRRCCFI